MDVSHILISFDALVNNSVFWWFKLQHCSSDGPECPTVFLERLCFEMKKGYKETMLQLVLSPVNLFLNDNYQVICLCSAIHYFSINSSCHVGFYLRSHAFKAI